MGVTLGSAIGITTAVLFAALVVYWAAVIVILIWEDREPYDTLAWILVLVLLPIIGIPLYFMFGRDWAAITMRQSWRPKMIAARDAEMSPIYARFDDTAKAFLDSSGDGVAAKVSRSIESMNGAHILPARTFDVYPQGADYFAILLEDLASAQRFIHMQYFIWERDELTTKVCDVLMDRLEHGVEVRILNDWFGNLEYKKDQLKRLKEAGAVWGSDVSQLAQTNYRNHRKITVVDGEIGHTGGVNIGQEYIDGGRKYPAWRDTGVRMTGPAVAGLQRLFAERWWERYHENLFTERYFPDPAAAPGTILTQIVAQGVEDDLNSSTRAYQVGMTGAKRRLLISSPYFVPDYTTRDAMINAALSGVEVHFIMTGWPDKRLAFDAAKSYWKRQVESGVHVYLYERGFFHSKSLVVDDAACAVGTMNLDIRSLRLHKELMVWNYDPACIQRMTDIFFEDLEFCREVTLEEIESWSRLEHFKHSFARLTSNLI